MRTMKFYAHMDMSTLLHGTEMKKRGVVGIRGEIAKYVETSKGGIT
jgi:hypothetical protein